MKRVLIAVLLCCLHLTAFAQDADEAKARAGCQSTSDKFMAAMISLDAKAVAVLYHENAVMSEPGMDVPIKGRAAIEAYYQSMFAGTSAIELDGWTEDNVYWGAVMVTVGHCMVKMTMKDGSAALMRADFTDVRKPDANGQWLYVNDFVAFNPVEETSGK